MSEETMTTKEFDASLKKAGYDDDDETRIVVAAVIVGPDQKKIAELTGLSRDVIRPAARRLRANRIWVGKQVACEDPEEGPSGIEVALWSCVAKGWMKTA